MRRLRTTKIILTLPDDTEVELTVGIRHSEIRMFMNLKGIKSALVVPYPEVNWSTFS